MSFRLNKVELLVGDVPGCQATEPPALAQPSEASRGPLPNLQGWGGLWGVQWRSKHRRECDEAG